MFGVPATLPVKRPSRISGSLAIRFSKPNSRAMGSVRKRLAAVVSTVRSPEDRCLSTSSRAADGYHRHDLLLQVFAAPVFELRQRMGRQGRDVELGEFEHADFTAPVAVDDLAVGALEGCPIEHAALDQKLDPGLIAIAGEQRVVEIEKG